MTSLLKQENLRIKITSKTKGVVLNIDEYISETDILNSLAYELTQNDCDIVLLQKSKKYSEKEYFSIASKVRVLVSEFSATLILEGQCLMANLLNVDGILLSEDDLPVDLLKDFLPENCIIGWYNLSDSTEILKEAEFLLLNDSNKSKPSSFPTFLKQDRFLIKHK